MSVLNKIEQHFEKYYKCDCATAKLLRDPHGCSDCLNTGYVIDNKEAGLLEEALSELTKLEQEKKVLVESIDDALEALEKGIYIYRTWQRVAWNSDTRDSTRKNRWRGVRKKCEACGANVEVVGDTTQYYRNLDQERIEKLEQENKMLGDELETYIKMSKSAHKKIAKLEQEKKVLVEAMKRIVNDDTPMPGAKCIKIEEIAEQALAKIGGEK